MDLGYKINIRLLTMRGFHPTTAAGDGCEIEVTGFPAASIKINQNSIKLDESRIQFKFQGEYSE